MKIRSKIILVVLPLITAALLITTLFSSSIARSGMNRLAMASLGFKARELEKYMGNQWNLLEANGLTEDAVYIQVAQSAIISYAKTLISSSTEIIFALDENAEIAMSTSEVEMEEQERVKLSFLLVEEGPGWREFSTGERTRVGEVFAFTSFDWAVLVTEDKDAFYREIQDLNRQNLIILAVSLGVSLFLILVLASYLSRPIQRIEQTVRDITETNDLSRKVEVEYKDEVGVLASTFNMMTSELERAYGQIKNFALRAVLAKKNEQKIRNIFQKYVPKDVIDSIFENPESMLVGEERIVAVLFSDIRSFTTISEGYRPNELVEVLNKYFAMMVDIIVEHNGIVDKYIGDAIMAFFGAPVQRPDDAYQAVLAGIEMQEALLKFNQNLEAKGKPKFLTGIGINFGLVTVGNIGSERKMDYTVIGDMVNLGSRLESLTKQYKQDLVFSKSVCSKITGKLPARLVDKVMVKGKTMGESVFTTQRELTEEEKKGWAHHNEGSSLYYNRNFQKAYQHFMAVQQYLPEDYLSTMYMERCKRYIKNPPPPDWNGTEVLASK